MKNIPCPKCGSATKTISDIKGKPRSKCLNKTECGYQFTTIWRTKEGLTKQLIDKVYDKYYNNERTHHSNYKIAQELDISHQAFQKWFKEKYRKNELNLKNNKFAQVGRNIERAYNIFKFFENTRDKVEVKCFTTRISVRYLPNGIKTDERAKKPIVTIKNIREYHGSVYCKIKFFPVPIEVVRKIRSFDDMEFNDSISKEFPFPREVKRIDDYYLVELDDVTEKYFDDFFKLYIKTKHKRTRY